MNDNNANSLNDFLNMGDSGGFDDLPFPEMVTSQIDADTTPKENPETVPEVKARTTENEDVKNEVVETQINNASNNASGQISMLSDSDDPLEAALKAAQAKSVGRMIGTFESKDAVFNYGKANEPITDRDCTFEDLRQKYEDDFPELSEAKSVEWTVTYGKEIKNITNPGSTKVYDIKSEIENSKKFTDNIKKAKTDADRNPVCIVKPRKKASTKGDIISLSAIKELCSTYEEAKNSKKAIVLLPSSDGRLYQMRNTDIGTFTAPIKSVKELPEINGGFKMNLPKIPMHILMFILDFFKELSDKSRLEALVHILYDTRRKKYTIRVPKQELTSDRVDSVLDEEYPDYMVHVMDIHSHNVMPAEFSPTDNKDEKETRLYAVVGRLDKVFPDISVRAGCGGEFIKLNPADVFDGSYKAFPHPPLWEEQISVTKTDKDLIPKKIAFIKAVRIGAEL